MKRTLLLFTSFFIVLISKSLFAQLPVITNFSPGKAPIGSLVTINGTNLSGVTSVKIGAVNALPISNDDSKLVIMVMPGTISGKIAIATLGGSTATQNNFNVTKSHIPDKQYGAKIIPPQYIPFGRAVALSSDGKTAIFGSPTSKGDKGSAYIYIFQNGTWVQQGPALIGTGVKGSGASQGWSVAISADGNTALVGGVYDDGYVGAAWVFVRDKDGNWSQQGSKLIGTGTVGPVVWMGEAVALSADGNTAIIGASENNNSEGGAWIFTRDINGIWSQQGSRLLGTGGGSFSTEGGAVAMSADGKTAVVGSALADAFWIFTKNASNIWEQTGSWYQGTGRADNFYSEQGRAVAISADGNTIVDGGNQDSSAYGAIWVFTRDSSGKWSQQGEKLTVNSIGKAGLGASISINAEGNEIIAGGWGDNKNNGASWIFTRNQQGIWSQHGEKLVGSDSLYSNQGTSIALSADGNIAMVGGGGMWVFTDSSSLLPVTLTDVKAYPFGKGIQTEWNGYNEIDLASYDVEKSTNAVNFNKVNNTPAHNGNNTNNNYTWFDASPAAGDNFYRIKAISKDGGVQYSPVVKVNIGSIASNIKITPNPVNANTINTQLTNIDAGKYVINLYTLNGKKIMATSYHHTGGSAVVSLTTNKLATGVYIIEVRGGKYNYTTKVVVE